jgi:hypothetical protein
MKIERSRLRAFDDAAPVRIKQMGALSLHQITGPQFLVRRSRHRRQELEFSGTPRLRISPRPRYQQHT